MASGPWAIGETPVGSHKGGLEPFGQRDVGGVVHRGVVPQLPAPLEQSPMRNAFEAQRLEIGQCCTHPVPAKLPGQPEAAPRRDDFEVDDFRSRQLFPEETGTSMPTVGAVVAQRGHEHAGIDDDHGASRSARTAAVAEAKLARPPVRCSVRARTSSSVGRRASSTRRASRYSCSDWPAMAARRRRVA